MTRTHPQVTQAVFISVTHFSWSFIAGWRPRRTVIFASWDAEEFGLLGSTEWAEVN